MSAPPRILYLEPFHGGSHRQFGDLVTTALPFAWTRLTLPARHWKWRMRSAAPLWALEHAEVLAQPYDAVLASSYTPLAELIGLAPSLAGTPSMLYFHENQFAFPAGPTTTEQERHRDLTYAFTQLTSALAATVCAFNSAYNRDSFLSGAAQVLARMPRPRPSNWVETIGRRSSVLYVPLELPQLAAAQLDGGQREAGPPRILWNHRWEHDKQPERFFDALYALQRLGCAFEVIVTGQRFKRSPSCFDQAHERLADHIRHWGYAESRTRYEELLVQADIAVSTANHEFFGIAMLEAAHFGAHPVVPDRLAYPETFPAQFRYLDDDLEGRLQRLVDGPVEALRADRSALTQAFRQPALDAIGEALLSLIP